MGKVFNTIGGGGTKATITNNEPSLTITDKVASAESDITATIKTDTYKYDSGGVVNYNFSVDGTQKQSGTTATYDFSSESFAEGSTHTIGVNVSSEGLPTSVTATKSYIAPLIPKATVTGLGSQYTSSVTFNVDDDFVFTLGEVTVDGNVFIKIPKMYRKVNMTDTNPQITSFTISNKKVDSTYEVYPCFLKEDGVTEMDYILIGKYCCSSTSVANSVYASGVQIVPSSARTLCQNKGTGYLAMDWQIFKLWQDLLICKMQKVNISRLEMQTDALGISWYQGGNYMDLHFVDGIAKNGTTWRFSYKPSAYVNNPSSSTANYYALNYSAPTSSNVIKVLGFDSNHPFVNYPKIIVSGSNTYYCDDYWQSSGNKVVYCDTIGDYSNTGAFSIRANYDWTDGTRFRLCYRPINE